MKSAAGNDQDEAWSTNVLLASLWSLEFSTAIAALVVYKRVQLPFSALVTGPTGVVFVGAVVASIASAFVVARFARKDTKRATAILVLNLVSVILAIASAEVVIRLFAVATPEGPVFAHTLLLPRSWDRIASRNRAVLARAASQGSFLVADDLLGWTIGPGRRSDDYNRDFVRRFLAENDGSCSRARSDEHTPPEEASSNEIYVSSAEGLRSPSVETAFARVPAHRRIALVGDSFTFGLEVRYEETWGHQLERILGADTQVLNFGVDGYGVDQAYLRYRKNVVAWHPDLVILGVIDDDLRRTMCVYGFLCFPGSDIPFAKPRFVLNGDTPELVNAPLPAPEVIFAKPSIMELPFIELDPAFRQRSEWEARFYHRFYAIRFLLSRFPRYPVPTPALSEEAMRSLNGEIVRSFLREAREHGSSAMVAYLPSHLPGCDAESSSSPSSVTKLALESAGVPFLDLTDCVDAVAPEERFAALHYSATTNAAVARCVADSIRSDRRWTR